VLRVLVMEISGSSAERTRSRSRTLDILAAEPGRPAPPPKTMQAELAAAGWAADVEAPAPVYELDSEALR
jgi:hypothetical protein